MVQLASGPQTQPRMTQNKIVNGFMLEYKFILFTTDKIINLFLHISPKVVDLCKSSLLDIFL